MTSSKPVRTLQQATALTFLSNEKQEPFTRNIQFSISATFYGKNQGSIYISFLFDDNDELLPRIVLLNTIIIMFRYINLRA